MAEAKKKAATAAKKTDEAKAKVVKKTTKTKAAAKPANLEEPVVAEQNVTEAALEAAQEEQTVIAEKRATADESELANNSAAVYDATLSEEEAHNGTTEEDNQTPTQDDKVTKAGKRSTKAQREAAEEATRQERKAGAADDSEAKPKRPVTPTRSRLERRGKHFRKDAEQIEAGKAYTIDEAVELAKKTSHTKFDATVEMHINLGVDPRHADQNIRDNLVLPAGTGKSVRVAVLTDDAAAATAAGAELVGNEDLLKELDKGVMNFDILIATPQLMSKLGKYARILGPRGLMPNPKSGTVTTDVNKAVAEAKAGRVEYRVDSTGIVHLGVGKVSFSAAQLGDNVQAILASIKSNKPQSVKGNYFKAIHLTTTMGPSITVDVASIS